MSFWLTLQIALRALGKNKLRAGLTVLGVVIGIAAVTTMVSLGQSASTHIQGQILSLGSNMIVVIPASQRRGGVADGLRMTLTSKDAYAIGKECPSVKATSPIVIVSAQVIYGNSNHRPTEMQGVGEDFLLVRDWPVGQGTFFDARDISSAAKVCVIGHTLVAKLFQTTNPIGETVRLNKIPFKVIGVMEKKGASFDGKDQDDVLFVPFTTARKRLTGSEFDNVNFIIAAAKNQDLIPVAQEEVKHLLLERHRIQPGDPQDFDLVNMTQFATLFNTIVGSLTMMLAAIAALSLLVGGVGIMNIMLVSVTERTREIGIRMAVGATSGDILRQFLLEAVMLSMVGGLIGFLLGAAASIGLTLALNAVSGQKWPIVISVGAAGMSFLFSGAVGIFFGYYPARRASQLDPIDALRYE